MPYLVQSDLHALVPAAFVVEALDDDRDGLADTGAWDAVQAVASEAVDSRLGGRYPVPFTTPLPALVVEAARIFACEALYLRRGRSGDENPFTRRANDLRAKLDAIGQGEQPLTPGATRARPPISIIQTPARTTPADGNMNF